ncbi:hypothetical protein RHMOL_Rhmol03G0107300 [Rhododendron molle]|uniref:Uncharacterized protein n=1 Tax=Rhododendron molle TaxID=49168 RepID=A0ACC0PCU3_RHOML|nr:hypothetical protein RHMOL_Rhmol03G0107300 [Rhododendron molle]
MASDLPGRIQLLIEKALREECLGGSCNGGLAKTPDLNLPPANLSSFWGHPVDMKIGFKDGVKAACCVCDTRKRSISGFRANPCGDIPNPGFILESSSKSISPPPGFPQPYMFMKQNPSNSLFGFDGPEDLPSLVCMGCVHCHMYILVSESAPKCPKCKSIDLLDISRLNEPMKKKARKN